MKLFNRYNRVNLLANIAIFVVASVAFYVSLRYVLMRQIDEDLQIEEAEILAFVSEHNQLPESFSVSDQVIHFTPAASAVRRRFSIVQMIDDEYGAPESYRRLTFGVMVAGSPYQATVSKSIEGTNSLLNSILLVSIGTIVLILLVSALINRVLLKKLWQPFYASLSVVKNFRPSTSQPLTFTPTGTDEFNTMNAALESMAKTARLEYLSLKTFSENASHEIQTPLAIIRSKLDLLIQDENLTEPQSKTLQSAYNAVEKLSRLNGSLLLLAKIENGQFEAVTQVDLKKKLEEKIADFQELWEAKGLTVTANLQPALVRMNNELADILLNNLLSNATNYNIANGRITVGLRENTLTLGNPSNYPALEPEKQFQRFAKSSTGNARNGLGLSIIKQICEASGFQIHYRHGQDMHLFQIQFT